VLWVAVLIMQKKNKRLIYTKKIVVTLTGKKNCKFVANEIKKSRKTRIDLMNNTHLLLIMFCITVIYVNYRTDYFINMLTE
jgi:hypothetical protein